MSAQAVKSGGSQMLVIVWCRGIIELKINPPPALANGETVIAECPSTSSNKESCMNLVISKLWIKG